VSTAIWNWPT